MNIPQKVVRFGKLFSDRKRKSYPFLKTFLTFHATKVFRLGFFSVCKGNIFFLKFQKIFQLFFHYFSGKKNVKIINYNLSTTYAFLHKGKVYIAQNHTLKNLKNT